MGYPCVRCGMCCIVAPCVGGDDIEPGATGECGHLAIDKDDNAVCTCEAALSAYVGTGCMFQHPNHTKLYQFHLSEYHVDERRKALKEVTP